MRKDRRWLSVMGSAVCGGSSLVLIVWLNQGTTVARASECGPTTWELELEDVRILSGSGDPAAERAYWGESAELTTDQLVRLRDGAVFQLRDAR